MAVHVFRIRNGGRTTAIYNDRIKHTLEKGDMKITRASHVEPGDPDKGQDPTKWYADMGPSGGPVLEGKDTREAALAAEVSWLLRNKFIGKE